jgi:crotonobetainyl-CoA:carnitine CoA-transferase CaiB-like acyl-CoA transferase
MPATDQTHLTVALCAVGLPIDETERLQVGGELGEPARLPVEGVGVACVTSALIAAARLEEANCDKRVSVALDRGQVRAALVSERLFRLGGELAGAFFAPLSRFWPTGDGWIRTHANYPWHRAALLKGLGVADEKGLSDAIAVGAAEQIEADVFAAGGVASAVRAPDSWLAHPQGAAVATEPLVTRRRLGDGERRTGFRVLDLTRVIAGPVCSRFLAALGADVLRIDPPALPDFEPGARADTLLGKRSAFLDFATDAGARHLEDLLDAADVVLLGYRPGALARFGLAPEDLAIRHPGLVIVELSAWGHSGPWAERRGFDSIVQAASGIAATYGDPSGTPGALPCQLLDHGTGYLAAAAVLAALAEQRVSGGTPLRCLSLARTAHWLLEAGLDDSVPTEASTDSPWQEPGAAFATTLATDDAITAVAPPGSLSGVPLRWPRGARYGADVAMWQTPAS